MKTVLIRFEARGSSSKILVWLLSWIHCIPMSMMMIPAMIPIKVFSPMKNSNQAKRINPQPIKLKRRTPTCFTYLPTKEAVNGEEGTEIQCRPDRINAQLRVFFH